MRFEAFNLSYPLKQALKVKRFIEPTPIQKQVIPQVQNRHDIVAQAQTGSGKSASFVVPILDQFEQHPQEGKAKIRALVLAPTRELTLQLSTTFKELGQFMKRKPKVVSLISGEGIGDQIFEIQQGCDVVVATTGRLLDVLSKKQMSLNKLEFFVLDEADKMLGAGFEEELNAVLEVIPTKRQNLLFSATFPEKMQSIIERVTHQALTICLDGGKSVATITQRAIEVDRENRSPLLRHLIKEEKLRSVLVFVASKRTAENIAQKFRRHRLRADAFHGDLYRLFKLLLVV
jgi:ATP-dependent RNA helicase RhlE